MGGSDGAGTGSRATAPPEAASALVRAALAFLVLPFAAAALSGCDGSEPASGAKESNPAAPGIPPAPVAAASPPAPRPTAPPEAVLRAQKEIPLPEGLLRDEAGRIRSAKDGAELVLVAGGEFTMGSGDSIMGNEKPAHRVSVAAFLIDRHEVTVGQYRRFCGEKGRPFPFQRPESTDAHPVVWVTWEDAKAYAEWAGRRLPTEAEWEKAARGADGRAHPWGDRDEPSMRNGLGAEDGYAALAPVGSFPAGASPCGALDMAGNVWEWCEDWYGEEHYGTSAAREPDPRGPPTGVQKILRGGGWGSRAFLLRCAYRNRNEPAGRYSADGFRCASSLP